MRVSDEGGSGLRGSGAAAPRLRISNDDLSGRAGTSDEWIRTLAQELPRRRRRPEEERKPHQLRRPAPASKPSKRAGREASTSDPDPGSPPARRRSVWLPAPKVQALIGADQPLLS